MVHFVQTIMCEWATFSAAFLVLNEIFSQQTCTLISAACQGTSRLALKCVNQSEKTTHQLILSYRQHASVSSRELVKRTKHRHSFSIYKNKLFCLMQPCIRSRICFRSFFVLRKEGNISVVDSWAAFWSSVNLFKSRWEPFEWRGGHHVLLFSVCLICTWIV